MKALKINPKRLIIAVALVVLAFVQARPVLVSVELQGIEQVKKWHRLDLPTYEIIEGCAIAEIEEGEFALLKQGDFRYQIIDEVPWSESYYVVTPNPLSEQPSVGMTVWHKGETRIIKTDAKYASLLLKARVQFHKLEKRLVPERCWKQLVSKTVFHRNVVWDPFIQGLVDQVRADSLTAYIQRLQDFRTRLLLTDSSYAASEWIRQKFTSWGYTPEFDSFYLDLWFPGQGYERNVIATSNGAMNPARVYLVGGHFDAIFWGDTAMARIFAPGADDNGSGTAGAMEVARIFKNYSWEKTIKYIGWAAEELGLLGSERFAYRADSLGMDIGGVLNMDMVGYMDDSNLDCFIQRREEQPLWLSELFVNAGQIYVPSLTTYEVVSGGGSDWYPFAALGFAAVGAEEAYMTQWNPYYHDTTDLLSTLSPELYAAITKVHVATLAILGLYPDMVSDVVALDLGDGSSLMVDWSANLETDINGYRIYYGLQSEVYTDTQYVSAAITIDTLTGLMSDSLYYIAVRAVDNDDHESYLSAEISCAPRVIPNPPAGVVATPINSGIRIDWHPNGELDFAGYRIYRRLNESPIYDSLNTGLLFDTTYADSPLSGANKYYYTVRAFDASGNPSGMSSEAYGRPITLDQGVLIVDETHNWTSGNYPRDSMQDDFYHYILSDYQYEDYEFSDTTVIPVLADLVPYSTVVWHADDYVTLLAVNDTSDLKNYLSIGGRLWFIGWRPTADLRGALVYPVDFDPGSFIHDYFKVAHVEISASSDSFQGATGLLGYPSVAVDPSKVPIGGWAGTMRYIEALTSFTPGENIFTMDMKNNTSPFEGEVCAVRYLGSDYKIVLLGFPLYFMDDEQARAIAEKVMDDFGEVGIAEQCEYTIASTKFGVLREIPSPNAGYLHVEFDAAGEGEATLRLFDASGRLVRNLWKGRTDLGVNRVAVSIHGLPAGAYFVMLESGINGEIGTDSRKVIVVH